MPGPFMLEEISDREKDSETPQDLSDWLLQEHPDGLEVERKGPFICIRLAQQHITKQCHRILDLGSQRFLGPAEIAEMEAAIPPCEMLCRQERVN